MRKQWTSGTRISNDAEPVSLASFEQQIQPHLPVVQATARRILGDDDAASDAVQEALIALWQSGEVPGHLRKWLLRTVVHRSLHLRRSRIRRRHWEDLGGERVLPCALCDPEREVEVRELVDCMDQALRELSSDHRDIVILRDIEGLEYREISSFLGVPIGTVRSRLNRARAQLHSLDVGAFVGEA